MKNRIVIALSAIALIATGVISTASAAPQTDQDKTGMGSRQNRRGPGKGNPFFGLDLTEEQKAALKSIQQNEREQIQAVRNNESLSEEEKKAQIQSIFQNSREQSHAVLTPEQQQELADRRANFDGPRGRRGGPRGGPGGLSGLGLTDEQKASLQQIHQSEREQIQAVTSDQSLSQEEKKAQIQSIRQSSREQSQAILTPEQQQILKDRFDNGGGRRGGFGGPGGPGGRRGGRRP